MERDIKKVYSVLGDSVSTFAGYTPKEAVFYDGWTQEETGVKSPEDTWWMQVICQKQGVLGVNNSYAGSMVSGELAVSGTSQTRIKALGMNGEPDVILVAMGANDWGFCVLPQEFADAYRKMLSRIKCIYPQAEIWCATLPRGKQPEGQVFFNAESTVSQEIYTEIIRKAAKETEVHLADLSRYHMEYDTIDGVHPNAAGMRILSELWLKEMR